MANYYCRKSSLEAIAAAIKTGLGLASSTKIKVSDFASRIGSFVIPTNRGSPTETLNTSKTSYPILKGKYTGGTVSVTTETKTATLSQGGSTVTPSSGKVLEKVTVPARDVFVAKSGLLTPTSINTFTITGLTFKPIGIAMYADETYGQTFKKPQLICFYWKNGAVQGSAVHDTVSTAPVTSATVTTTNTSITISNVVATYNGTSFNCTWKTSRQWCYFVWG